MNPQPKQLALLISLIGVGVSPGAWARSDLRVVRDALCLQDLLLDASADTRLAPSDLSVDPRWLPQGGALEATAMSGGWLLHAAAAEDTVPGERLPDVDEAIEPSASPVVPVETAVVDAVDLLQAPSPEDSGVLREVRVLAPAPRATPARIEAHTIERSPRAEVRAAASEPSHSERALQSLAAFMDEAPLPEATADAQEPAEFVDNSLVPSEERDAAGRREPGALRRDSVDIVVDTESSKVLRLLEAIRSDERDEVGAVKADFTNTVVTTQRDKVMAMLDEVTSATREPDDGATRRARKLAAAAERAEALTRVPPNTVDVLLPLELPAAGVANAANDASWPETAEAPVLPPLTARAALRPRSNPFGDQRVALDEKRLDGVRGGFVGDGLNISFGIERAVYVNGVLVTSTSLNMSDLGRMTAGRGTTSFDAGTIALVQSGAGNLVTTGTMSSATMGTIVQNTLDGQKIQSVTVINASVNSLGVLRNLNFQSSLRGAVIDSLRR